MVQKKEKRFGSKIALKIALLITVVIISFFIYIIYDFGKGFEPQRYKGKEARGMIENFCEMKIPVKAKNLFYYSHSFQNGVYYIGMSVNPLEAWQFIKNYSGKDKKDFKKDEVLSGLSGPEKKDKFWSISDLKEPLIYSVLDKKKEYSKMMIYDEKTERLLISFSTW